MKKYFILSLVASVVFAGCSSSHLSRTQNRISGTYQNKEFNYRIQFTDSSFVYTKGGKNNVLAEPCCDTIAFGSWRQDSQGYLTLNSPDWMKTFFVDFEVKENNKPSNDTIYFYINNPIEEQQKKDHSSNSDLIYSLSVLPEGGSYDYFKENGRDFDAPVIKYFNPRHLGLESFSITLQAASTMPVRNLSVRYLLTVPYKIKSPKTNVFEIYFPGLSYAYFNLKRLNEDYLKIIDSNTLRWDGLNYIKIE